MLLQSPYYILHYVIIFFKEFIFANNVHNCIELIFRCMKMLKLCEFNFVRLNNVEFDHWVLNARSLHPDIKV